MLIHEVTSSLQLFSATVRVSTSAGGTSSFKTAVHAESAQHARQLLTHLYGVNSVTGLVLVRGKFGEAMTTTTAASGPLTADQLRLKALSDQKAQIGQREKQERARQKLVKAQQQMAKSRQTAVKTLPTLDV